MTTKTKINDQINKSIAIQENELKELLSRVMTSPLQPLYEQAAELDKRLQNIEDFSKLTSEVSFPAMQREIRAQGDEMRKILKGFSSVLTEDLADLVNARLASMPQEVTQILQVQTLVSDMLRKVQYEQNLQNKLAGDVALQSEALLLKSFDQLNEINHSTKVAAQASEKAVARINESCGHINNNLDSMQAEGRMGAQLLGDGLTALAGSVSLTSAQVTELVPTLARRTDELGSRLDCGVASFRRQSETDRGEVLHALQVMQKRFVWLSVLCGLSFVGSVGLVVSRFVFRV